ncbi:FdhD protein [Pedobacter rhizosphaerae]|uniref:Sulfur carrier protein FdhD n=2 Tax=Pedobacter rhizosphaerae TaxID=390241 RepID=A0A1H9SI50_9SPHI|nr:FdhD protein [Pedobacter rhizosphaerae]
MNGLPSHAVIRSAIQRISVSGSHASLDVLSVEEPLEIRLEYGPANQRVIKSISVTMRTPGNDQELALGFLYTEGMISSAAAVKKVYAVKDSCSIGKENIICVALIEGVEPNLAQAERNFYTTSSCGVCGKASIASIRTKQPAPLESRVPINLDCEILYGLPEKLRLAQHSFDATGGIHAAGLFTLAGELVMLREDVGRHNALDKLIGSSLSSAIPDLNKHILLLSGRASFELIQKAAMAGISIVAAIGAPSSLAVELATESKMTLLGFLKENRFNIYISNVNIIIPQSHENKTKGQFHQI